MNVRELAVSRCFEFAPMQHRDERGTFLEWYRADPFAAAVGHRLTVAQANHSVSRRGTLRGIHYALVPPGQGKYVYCPRGAVVDVVIDLRVGSPTFGVSDSTRLDEVDRRAVYLPEGVGHAFMALVDDSALTYLCSTGYDPGREKAVNVLDPEVDLPWPADIDPVISERDRAAPSLQQARSEGMLPSYDACLARYEALRTSGQ
ncbi:MAG: dTDP-4-dehydrorhamnose 3,5-epimerase family protein [Geodermatophilaceae bacterium]|jgi:dTDP-4-dehydrorhamnose 3,5-epimerase|nr:dTDP-4-dehydrorhamnose 3,5-epimerase family protein [Geodermatophilaceae bacterium]